MRRLVLAGLFSVICTAPLHADDAVTKTIADLYTEKSDLDGKQVTVSGTVVKVNNQIMNRNFVHIQDGTGNPEDGTNDLTLTSQDTANLGDEVTISGTLVIDQDFGFGYSYPLIVEQAQITKTK